MKKRLSSRFSWRQKRIIEAFIFYYHRSSNVFNTILSFHNDNKKKQRIKTVDFEVFFSACISLSIRHILKKYNLSQTVKVYFSTFD